MIQKTSRRCKSVQQLLMTNRRLWQGLGIRWLPRISWPERSPIGRNFPATQCDFDNRRRNYESNKGCVSESIRSRDRTLLLTSLKLSTLPRRKKWKLWSSTCSRSRSPVLSIRGRLYTLLVGNVHELAKSHRLMDALSKCVVRSAAVIKPMAQFWNHQVDETNDKCGLELLLEWQMRTDWKFEATNDVEI